MSTVIVAGALANKAGSGGEAWVRMSWVRGLQRLGFDVRFVEEIDPSGASPDAVTWFERVVTEFGLADVSTLIAGGTAVAGPPIDDLVRVASHAPLVNISGNLSHPPLFDVVSSRILVDIDPGFTQFWHAQGNPGARVDDHDLHFTIGENIGRPDCSIPTSGVTWHTVRQPVVLADWPLLPVPPERRFTTVANWRGPFGPVEFGGHTYGLKVHEFRKLVELPQRCPDAVFELALAIDPADERDRADLVANGWRLGDPVAASATPDAFRRYVQGSFAELSVAQGIYVDTNSGWFSDRSVRYLASGRPVIVQETGFTPFLPTGEGLLAFAALDEAIARVETVLGDPMRHAAAARSIAEAHFAHDVVLPPFCERAGIG